MRVYVCVCVCARARFLSPCLFPQPLLCPTPHPSFPCPLLPSRPQGLRGILKPEQVSLTLSRALSLTHIALLFPSVME